MITDNLKALSANYEPESTTEEEKAEYCARGIAACLARNAARQDISRWEERRFGNC